MTATGIRVGTCRSALIKTYDKTTGLYSSRTVVDGGVGDLDKKKNGVIKTEFGVNTSNLIRKDGGKVGVTDDDHAFMEVVTDTTGKLIVKRNTTSIAFTEQQGLKPGYSVTFYDSNGTRIWSAQDNHAVHDWDLNLGRTKFVANVPRDFNGYVKIGEKTYEVKSGKLSANPIAAGTALGEVAYPSMDAWYDAADTTYGTNGEKLCNWLMGGQLPKPDFTFAPSIKITKELLQRKWAYLPGFKERLDKMFMIDGKPVTELSLNQLKEWGEKRDAAYTAYEAARYELDALLSGLDAAGSTSSATSQAQNDLLARGITAWVDPKTGQIKKISDAVAKYFEKMAEMLTWVDKGLGQTETWADAGMPPSSDGLPRFLTVEALKQDMNIMYSKMTVYFNQVAGMLGSAAGNMRNLLAAEEKVKQTAILNAVMSSLGMLASCGFGFANFAIGFGAGGINNFKELLKTVGSNIAKNNLVGMPGYINFFASTGMFVVNTTALVNNLKAAIASSGKFSAADVSAYSAMLDSLETQSANKPFADAVQNFSNALTDVMNEFFKTAQNVKRKHFALVDPTKAVEWPVDSDGNRLRDTDPAIAAYDGRACQIMRHDENPSATWAYYRVQEIHNGGYAERTWRVSVTYVYP